MIEALVHRRLAPGIRHRHRLKGLIQMNAGLSPLKLKPEFLFLGVRYDGEREC
jgi:hypothetical protein